MNVSIMACVVFWVMRRLRLSDVLASAATVILCAAYAFVTDVGPPVWRAVLMLTSISACACCIASVPC